MMKLTKKKCKKALNKFIEGTNYFLEDKVENDNKYEIDVLNNLIKEHFELIKHTAPKKPIYVKPIDEFRCPCCGRIVLTYFNKMNYCKNCGQCLDWSKFYD